MLSIKKYQILDENNHTVAVQISIDDFRKIEAALEDYGLSRLIDETENEEVLSVSEAKSFYSAIKDKNV